MQEKIFIVKDGPDAVREGLPYVERNAVVAVVKHWSENKYLCSAWKKTNWKGFIIGGIEEDETIAESAIREVKEETGYQNMELLGVVPGIVHSKFYHPIKNVNRFAHFQTVLLKLSNEEKYKISDDEDAIHEVVWIEKEKVGEFITAEDMKEIWKRMLIFHQNEGIRN